MKRNFVALLFMGLSFSALCSDKIVSRTTKDGGAGGYNRTSYNETDSRITIDCYDPGFESCPAVPSGISSGTAVNYALNQIALNNLSGNTTINVNGVNFKVTWSAKDSSGKTSSIQVNPL